MYYFFLQMEDIFDDIMPSHLVSDLFLLYNFQCASLVILVTSMAMYFIRVDIIEREFFLIPFQSIIG